MAIYSMAIKQQKKSFCKKIKQSKDLTTKSSPPQGGTTIASIIHNSLKLITNRPADGKILKFFIYLFVTILVCFNLWAEDYPLFNNKGEALPNYDNVVTSLKHGDRLFFSDGKYFTFLRLLGNGKNTLVLEVAELPGKALRVALKTSSFRYIDTYVQGDISLSTENIPHVKLYANYSNQYAIVEKIEKPFLNFDEMIDKLSSIDPKDIAEQEKASSIAKKLSDFLIKLSLFYSSNDMTPDNLIYDIKAERWVLLDWFGELKPVRTVDDFYPTMLLTTHYGSVRDDQFKARKPHHQWLDPIFNKVLLEMKKRRVAHFSTLACSNLY